MKCIRKLLSIALALVMIQAILTSTASAAPYSVVHPKEGDYYIICSNGGYALDVTGGGDAAQCTPIQLYETNQTDAQIWKLVHVDGDWYLIVHKRTGMVLNVQHGDARQDGRLWLYPNDGTGACYWRFMAAGNQYLIQNQLGEQFVLDLHDNVSYNGALVHLWDIHDGPSARWQLALISSSVVTHESSNVSVLPRSRKNQPHYTNSAGQRSADALNIVLDQFEVATNKRHQKDSNGTYCNIFTWDATFALGCEIPHWTLNNAPASSTTPGARELNANATCDWLNSYGGQYGWYVVSAYEAQQRANSGYPTIATWKNLSGGSGHVAMVRPEGYNYSYSSRKGPVIAQAGAANYNYANVSTGFGSSMSAVVYWTHE